MHIMTNCELYEVLDMHQLHFRIMNPLMNQCEALFHQTLDACLELQSVKLYSVPFSPDSDVAAYA